MNIKDEELLVSLKTVFNEFATNGETNSAQAEQISAGSQRLTELATKLLNSSEDTI